MSKAPRSTHLSSGRSRFLRTTRVLLGAAAVGLLAGCSSESLTAPAAAQPSNGLIGDLLGTATSTLGTVTGLLRLTPVITSVTRSRTFDRNGGQLAIPELGFSLKVPAGAIPGQTLTISVTAIAGRMVAYNFEPHGTKFLKPLTISQELTGTNGLLGSLISPDLLGGYFKSDSQLNPLNNTAVIDEAFQIRTSGSTASFDIWHFSGYMVSTGRSAPE